jgi:uncharacterized RDD family membrane protein YckC
MNGTRPAGFWIRAVALVLDVAVFALVRHSFEVAAGRVWGLTVEDSMSLRVTTGIFALLFAGLYVTLLHAATGQTIGKMLVGARVVRQDGAGVSVGASLLRSFAYALSLLPLGLGYLMAGLRHDKRALHDLIAGTRVDRVGARATAPLEPSERTSPVT